MEFVTWDNPLKVKMRQQYELYPNSTSLPLSREMNPVKSNSLSFRALMEGVLPYI